MGRAARSRAAGWTAKEAALFRRLKSPEAIQDFLDAVPYSPDSCYRSPRSVIRDRRAHCFDGALFAACALRWIGFAPRLVDLRAVRDDDHILALYQRHGRIGAVAKSNFVGLRFREPMFRSLRELALSYFEPYYNLDGEKSLREYSVPLDLRALDRLRWMTEDEGLEVIAERLDAIRHFRLLTPAMEAGLRPVDPRMYRAGMLGAVQKGLYKPGGHKG